LIYPFGSRIRQHEPFHLALRPDCRICFIRALRVESYGRITPGLGVRFALPEKHRRKLLRPKNARAEEELWIQRLGALTAVPPLLRQLETDPAPVLLHSTASPRRSGMPM
jgi:hypothetical protein